MRRVTIPRAARWGGLWVLTVTGIAWWLGRASALYVWPGVLWSAVAAGYYAGWGWSLGMVGLVGGVGLLGVAVGALPPPILRATLACLAIPALFRALMPEVHRRLQAWDLRRQALLDTTRTLTQQQAALRAEHATLEHTMDELAKLYDLTKHLLATLDRTEAMRDLTDALLTTFPRITFRLGFLEPDAEERCLRLWELHREGLRSGPPTAAEQWLCHQLMRRPMIWSAWPSMGVAPVPMTDIPEALRTATAFPFVMAGTLHGFLLALNLPPDGIERCGILVSQFALAIRRIRLYERVQELAIHDGLTGLFVRRHFLARLQEEMARAARRELSFAFLMVDIDHFKLINDHHGHLVGDAVLRELAALLRTQVREVDLLGRYGGEEFALGLPETDMAHAEMAAERIRRAVEQTTFRAYDEHLTMTVSIGVAAFPHDAVDVTELVEHADAALYKAKLGGRNRVCLFGT